jgi:hypothetical protein
MGHVRLERSPQAATMPGIQGRLNNGSNVVCGALLVLLGGGGCSISNIVCRFIFSLTRCDRSKTRAVSRAASRARGVDPPVSRAASRARGVDPPVSRAASRARGVDPPVDRAASRARGVDPPVSRAASRARGVDPPVDRGGNSACRCSCSCPLVGSVCLPGTTERNGPCEIDCKSRHNYRDAAVKASFDRPTSVG